jgi:hypothetical protein
MALASRDLASRFWASMPSAVGRAEAVAAMVARSVMMNLVCIVLVMMTKMI